MNSDPFADFENQGLGNNGFEVSLNYISGLPDANMLSDPKLKIIFKSMLKKDDTTKEKLLSDLLKILNDESQSQLINDDLVIISWVQLYAKLAFDVSKNVRLNSHQVQSSFVKILGKKYAKYLKDTAPIWLAGIYDSERVVSRAVSASLMTAFQSQEKIDLLWKLFAEQALNFCYQVVVFEATDTLTDERNVGKEEAKAKFVRVTLCAVNVLNKLLSTSDLTTSSNILKKLLASEELWEISSSKDLNLKKALLMMIVTIIKVHPELLDDKLFKTTSKSIIKSMKYKPATNNILYSLIALPTLSAILNSANFNDQFWIIAGKKAKEKFFAFIELGSCSSSEVYYELLERILSKVPKEIINYEDEADFKKVSDILVQDILQEKLIAFKNKAWFCFLSTEEKFHRFQSKTVSSLLKPVLLKALHGKLSRDVLKTLIDFYKSTNDFSTLNDITDIVINSFPNKESDSNVIENVYDLLSGLQSEMLDLLVQRAFDSLDTFDEDGEEYKPPVTSFVVFNKVITGNFKAYKDNINQFLDESLASFVEQEFVEVPLALLINYNNNNEFLDKHILNEAFNSLFSKLLMIDEGLIPVALGKIPRLTHIDIKSCPDVQAFIFNKSQDVDYVDSSKINLIFNFLTKETFINLFKNSVETESEETFIAEFLSKFDKNVLSEFLQSQDPTVSMFFHYLFETVSHSNSSKLLQAIDAEHDSVFIENLISYASKYPLVEVDQIVVFLNQFKPEVVAKVVPKGPEGLISKLRLVVDDVVDLRLAIANPLEGGIFLASHDLASTFEKQKSLDLILYARFIVALVRASKALDPKIVVCLALIGELAMDYCFLSEDDNDELMNAITLFTVLSNETFKSFALNDLVAVVFNGKVQELNETLQFFSLQTEGENSVSYYFNRVLKSILTNLIDSESLQNFEKLDINLNLLMRKPLKFSTFIISCKKFLTSAKFERARNVAASELIGLKSAQITSKGLINLTILNDFLLCDSSSFGVENFVPVPEQRFNMVLRDLGNWLESDVAYDEEFILVRIQLTSFVGNYISLARHSLELDISKILELGLSLFRDSIGLVVLEQTNEALKTLIIPLRYFSLKLFILLERNKGEIEAWDDEIEGIYEELIESLLSQPVPLETNQSLSMTNELYYKIFDSLVPLKYLKIGDFYKLLEAKGNLQKLAVNILDKLILSNQQDQVIEYELNASKISTETLQDDTSNTANFPQILIDNILQVPEEYLEYEDTSKMNKFLWSWYLIFDHLKEITQRMREDYIKQLKPYMNQFFQFVFEQIDLNTDMELIKRLSSANEIKEYDISTTSDYESVDEQKRLIIHLYYLSLELVRSLAQAWFQTIRDRQLKTLIENFTVNYISPIVIDNEMNKAADLISSKSFDEENLTIKINRITHEVKSSYLIDEKTMEMVIKIPSSYPFQNVIVDGPVRLGVKETQWKSWLLASQRVINAQNSTIIGAIELFNRNVSLHFSGFEECAICYSILHYQDNSLPSKTCTTCNNKFHAACLYKWFKSSGGSTCPLCRSTFNFRK